MNRDMTTGNPASRIVLFMLPLLGGNLFQQLYSIADTIIVGQVLGVGALAAVGCTTPIMWFIIMFSSGLTGGMSVITAQRQGAKQADAVRRSFASCIIIGMVNALLVSLLGALFARRMLEALNTPADILEDAVVYITVIFLGTTITMLYNTLSSSMRALGNSQAPLIFLIIASVMNILLVLFFILIAKSGLAGVGLGTVIAQGISALLCMLYIRRRMPALWLRREDWRIGMANVREHLRMGLPLGLQGSIIALGALVLQYALNGLGTDAVAAFSAAMKVDSLATMPLISFASTLSVFVAQNYGARDMGRIRQGFKHCTIMSVSWALLMGIVNGVFGEFFAGFFVGNEPAIIALIRQYLIIQGACYIFHSLLNIFRHALQGLGNGWVPALSSSMELIMRSFTALVLIRHFGFTGACFASPLSWFGAGLPMAVVFLVTMRKLKAAPRP